MIVVRTAMAIPATLARPVAWFAAGTKECDRKKRRCATDDQKLLKCTALAGVVPWAHFDEVRNPLV
jgi:hypothetical protein